MILLSQRQKDILINLVEHQAGVKIDLLAKKLSISRRTLYREFSELSLYLKQHSLKIDHSSGVYYLNGETSAKHVLINELNLQQTDQELSVKQRQAALACDLLLRNRPQKIVSLAIDLDVSEGTIQRDLKQITKSLAEYNLKVEVSKSVGVFLTGEEPQKRLVLCGILTSQMNEYQFFEYLRSPQDSKTTNYFLNLFPKRLLQQCATALCQTEMTHQTRSDIQEVQLILIFAISTMKMRIQPLKEYQIKQPQTLFKYRRKVLDAYQHFSKDIQSRVTIAEVDFMAVQFKGIDYQLDFNSWIDNEDLKVTFKVRKLINSVSNEFGWNFCHDSELLDRLSKHIALLLKKKGSILPDSPIGLLENISIKYPELFKNIKKSLNQIFKGVHFSNSEQQLILLYFANSYENFSNSSDLQALVICANGIGAASILKSRLAKEVPSISRINIAKVSELKQIHPEKYDLILSTLSLPGFAYNYHVVTPLLLSEELHGVKKIVHSLNQQKQKNKGIITTENAVCQGRSRNVIKRRNKIV